MYGFPVSISEATQDDSEKEHMICGFTSKKGYGSKFKAPVSTPFVHFTNETEDVDNESTNSDQFCRRFSHLMAEKRSD
jgi:hypothetical protein